MTLVILLLILFIVLYTKDKTKVTKKRKDYIKSQTSNASLQHDIACGICEDMAKKYRYLVSQMTPDEYFEGKDSKDLHRFIKDSDLLKTKWYVENREPKAYDKNLPDFTMYCDDNNFLFNYAKFVNESDELVNFYDSIAPWDYYDLHPNVYWISSADNHKQGYLDYEKIWLIATANACGYPIDDNIFRIYKEEIWDMIPIKYEKINLTEWRKKFPHYPKKKGVLERMLQISVLFKRNIMRNDNWDEEGRDDYNGLMGYVCYDHKGILDKVAQLYNLPTESELKSLKCWIRDYRCLSSVAARYAKKKIEETGISSLDIGLISSIPTEKDKMIASGNMLVYEQNQKEREELSDLRKKYPNIH